MGLAGASLVVAAFATGIEIGIWPVAAKLNGSWDLLGMNWRTGRVVQMKTREERLEEQLTTQRNEQARDQDLLSTSPYLPFGALQKRCRSESEDESQCCWACVGR